MPDEPTRPQRAGLIVNARSGRGRENHARARDLLREAGVPLQASYPIHDPARVAETVQTLLDDGCDLIILGAGDGTVSTVVDFLADKPVTLGLLPLGTANDFARTLQIPADLRAACQAVATGKIVDVDLGLAGDNYFVNVASAGLSVTATRSLSPVLKKIAGPLAYPVAVLRAFLRHKAFTVRLTFPDGDHEPCDVDRVLQVAVGNGQFYGGGNRVAPEAGIDDHALDVYVIRLGRRRDLVDVARNFRSGRFVHSDAVTHLTTRRVVVRADPAQPLNIDGEIVTHTPQQFTVARNALRLLVPAHSTAARLDRGAAE